MFLKDFAHCVWPAAPYIHCAKAEAIKRLCNRRTHGESYCGHGYVPLRFMGNVVMRMGIQQHCCAKKIKGIKSNEKVMVTGSIVFIH